MVLLSFVDPLTLLEDLSYLTRAQPMELLSLTSSASLLFVPDFPLLGEYTPKLET